MLQPKTTAQTLCEPAQSKRMSVCHKSQYYTDIYRKNAASQNHAADFVASLRSRNACQDFTRATLYGNLQEKCCNPNSRCRLCASLRSRNACQNVTRATLYGNLQVKCRRPKPRRDFVGACAVETHVKISQEPLYAEIYT